MPEEYADQLTDRLMREMYDAGMRAMIDYANRHGLVAVGSFFVKQLGAGVVTYTEQPPRPAGIKVYWPDDRITIATVQHLSREQWRRLPKPMVSGND